MNKIEALEKTIYNLENNLVEYDWQDCGSCNCGVVARTLINGEDPYRFGFNYSPTTSKDFGAFANAAYCMTTNLPIPEVFQALKDAGFVHRELAELEFLGNPIIGAKAGLHVSTYTEHLMVAHGQFQQKENLIKYLKAWVEVLKSEHQQQKAREIIRYISVPESLTRQAKETILTAEITS